MRPDASKRIRRHAFLFLLGSLLFGVGAVRHLRAGGFDIRSTIHGHAGDGLFNLWVLEHVFLNLPQGLRALSDGRIFHPAENAYWWSDNSLATSAFYSLPRLAGVPPVPSFVLTAFVLSALAFAAICFLFAEIRRSSGAPAWTRWIVPFAAYLAFFTHTRIKDAEHFQYQFSVFWIFLLAAALRHNRDRRRRDFAGMACCTALLMATGPYFTLLGLCVLLPWAWLLAADARVDLRRWALRNLPLALPFLPPFLYIAWQYASASPGEIPLDTVRAGSVRLGRFLSLTLPGRAPMPREALGAGACLAMLLCGTAWTARHAKLFRQRGVWLPLLLFAASFAKIHELRPYDAWLRAGICLWAAARLAGSWRKGGCDLRQGQFLFLAGVAALTLGMALGPGKDFGKPHFIPNVWGLFSAGVPGFRGMRHLIRFAAMAQLAVHGLLFAAALRLGASRRGRAWTAAFALLAALHLVQHGKTRSDLARLDPDALSLQAEERGFFGNLQGVMLVVPAAPFHRNSQHMLRWIGCSGLSLLNGYSGRLPPAFAEIIRLENHHGRASPEQIAAAVAQGADFLCIPRAYVADATEDTVAAAYPVLFANPRFLVVDLRTARSDG